VLHPYRSTIFSAIIIIAIAYVAVSGCISFLGSQTPSVHAYINIEASAYDPVKYENVPNVPIYLVAYREGFQEKRDLHLTQVTNENGIARFTVDYVIDKENAVVFIGASTNKSQVESDFMNGVRAGGAAGNCLFFNYNIVTGGDESLKEVTVDRMVTINKNTGKVSNW